MKTGIWLITILLMETWSSQVFAEDANETEGYVGTFLKISEVTCFGNQRVAPGSKYDFERSWTDANGEFAMISCHDRHFELTFRIDEVLIGNLHKGSEIKVHIFDPNSIPAIAFRKTSLFSVYRRDDSSMQISNSVAVYAKKSGGFAQCGCKVSMRFNDDVNAGDACKSMEFEPSVSLNLVDASEYHLDSVSSDPTFEIQGDHAVCKRGLDVMDVLSVWKKVKEHD